MLNIKRLFAILLFFSVVCHIHAQDRIAVIESKLEEMVKTNPALLETVDISVTDVSVQEFLRGVAMNVGLNLIVDPSLQILVVNNFSDVKVIDIILFFCKEYDLDITTTGKIISIEKYLPPTVEKPKPEPKEIILYNNNRNLLTLDIKQDTLSKIARQITNKTNINVVVESDVSNTIVSGYIKEMPFDNALEKFTFANQLTVNKTDDNFYIISSSKKQTTRNKKRIEENGAELDLIDGVKFQIKNRNSISLLANNVDVYAILKTISDSLRVNYAILSDINEKVSANLTNITYDDFLTYLLEGSNYRYQKQGNVYIIGEKTDLSISTTETIYLKHRTVEKIIDFIPTDLKGDVELLEFNELNALFVTGHQQQVEKVKRFVNSIDMPVPVILIEVLIVDIYKSNIVSTGIRAGFGENPSPSSQTILPGIDYELSTEEINNIFGQINGLGWINLGQVTPDFYLAIQALEQNDLLKIRSTPKLSTLNGHNALLTSGETRYYKEERNNYIGTQNPALSNSYTWKPINADLSISIKPVVSGDEHITLEIEVNQAEFQNNASSDDNSPPGSVTRGFKSSIRMKNQEMILLGGLDKVTTSKSSRGTPILSRIPIIKWFFSSKTDSKTENKLSLFIQPTIIY